MTDARSLERSGVERSANEVRAQLRDTLTLIDRRRHELLDPERQLREHRTEIAIASAGVLVGIGALLGYAIHRASPRGRWAREQRVRERRRRERQRALTRAYRHPEWIAQRPVRREDVLATVAKKALTATLSFAALELAMSTARRAIEPARTPASS